MPQFIYFPTPAFLQYRFPLVVASSREAAVDHFS